MTEGQGRGQQQEGGGDCCGERVKAEPGEGAETDIQVWHIDRLKDGYLFD